LIPFITEKWEFFFPLDKRCSIMLKLRSFSPEKEEMIFRDLQATLI